MSGDLSADLDAMTAALSRHRLLDSEDALVRTAGPFAASPEALEAWTKSAMAGQVCIFARGGYVPPVVGKKSRVLAQRGLLTLRQGRHLSSDLFNYMARRTGLLFSEARPAAAPEPLSIEARLLLAALVQVADARGPCPTNAALAAMIGVRSVETVSRLLARLMAAQQIAVLKDVAGGSRVIEILDTGAYTAAGQ